jgi:hypothetical protein
MMTAALIWMAFCGYLNKWRGSGLGPWNPVGWSSTIQRIVLSFVLAAPAIYASPIHGAIIAVLLFWPGFAMGWGSYFDFGVNDDPPEVWWIDKVVSRMEKGAKKDYIAMSLRGLHFTVPTAIVAAFVTPVALILAPLGLLMGPTYYLSKKWTNMATDDYIKNAELVWGALLGAIFFDLGLLMMLA